MKVAAPILAGMALSMLLTLAPTVRASPPAGAPPKDAAEAFAMADLVFEGRVERVFKDEYGYDSAASVHMLRVWKGDDRLSVTERIDGKGGPTYPARVFRAGEVYLFYLPSSGAGQPLRADSYLQRVLTRADAGDDLKLLAQRPSTVPRARTGTSR